VVDVAQVPREAPPVAARLPERHVGHRDGREVGHEGPQIEPGIGWTRDLEC
jgi:hypothetical protein